MVDGAGDATSFYYVSHAAVNSLSRAECCCVQAGGNGPHSGGGKEHGRRNSIGLATAPTHALAGLRAADPNQAAATVWTREVVVREGRLRLRLSGRGSVEASVVGLDGNSTAHVETDAVASVAVPLAVADGEGLSAGQRVSLRFVLRGGVTLYSWTL